MRTGPPPTPPAAPPAATPVLPDEDVTYDDHGFDTRLEKWQRVPGVWIDAPWPKGTEGRQMGRGWCIAFRDTHGHWPTQGYLHKRSSLDAAQQCKRILRDVKAEVTPEEVTST